MNARLLVLSRIKLKVVILSSLILVSCGPFSSSKTSTITPLIPTILDEPVATIHVPAKSADAVGRQTPSTAPTVPVKLLATPAISDNATLSQRKVEVDPVGHIGGISNALAVQGQYVYLGEGMRMLVLDVSDPESPHLVGQSTVLGPGVVNNIVTTKAYAYVTTTMGELSVLSIANPFMPSVIGSMDLQVPVKWIALDPPYAYLASGVAGVMIIDISDPKAPKQFHTIASSNITTAVSIAGHYLYVTESSSNYRRDLSGFLKVFDITNPAAPIPVATLEMPYFSQGITIIGNQVYLACAGLCVVDISEPLEPHLTAFHEGSGFFYDDIAVAGSHAFISENQYCDIVIVCPRRVSIVDLTSPGRLATEENKAETKTSSGQGAGKGIVVLNSWLYLAEETGLTIMDSNTLAPIGKYRSIGLVGDVTVSGENAYVVDKFDQLHTINVSDPARVQAVSTLKDCGICTQLVASNGYVFVTVWDQGVALVDVNDQKNPIALTQIEMRAGDLHLALSDDQLFVVHEVDRLAHLRIFNISNPALPYESSLFELQGGGITDIILLKDQAYIASEGRLEIIDVANPEMPQKVGEYVFSSEQPDNEWTSTVGENYGFMIRRAPGLSDLAELLVIDLSNPTRPQLISTLALSQGDVRDITVADNYAYILGINGMSVFDISDPDNPRQAGVSRFGGEKIFVDRTTLYVAGGEMGLLILNVKSIESIE